MRGCMGKTKRNIKLIVLCIMLFSWATIVYAFSFGPPASNTGAPGEGTCNSCHDSFALNSGGGSVTITGLPQKYTPGMRYDITVTVAKSDRSRWGFQITALATDG